jgi:hypothetical protein
LDENKALEGLKDDISDAIDCGKGTGAQGIDERVRTGHRSHEVSKL